MKAQKMKAAVAAAMLAASAAPSFAQIDEVFRIFGQAVEADMRRQQERRQQEAEQRRLNQQQDAIRLEEIAATKRLQTALASLGFYSKAIDGDFGPGTQAALAAFQRAFDIPAAAISIADVAVIEGYARAEFRSEAEQAAANEGGFPTRAAMIEAHKGGFDNYDELQLAKSAGFLNRADFVAFRTSKFADAAEFRRAKEDGFVDYDSWRAAAASGFAQKEEFEEFRASGLPDRKAWLAEKAMRAELTKSRQACTAAAESSDILEAVRLCARAVLLAPADLLLNGHLAELRVTLASEAKKLEKLSAKKVTGSKAKLDAARLVEAEARCVSERAAASLQEAARICAALADQFAGSEFLRSTAAALGTEAIVQEQEAAIEQKRIALESARTTAKELISAIEDYSQNDLRLANGLETARALVGLRAVLAGEEAEPIEAAIILLQKLLASDAGFNSFQERREQAERAAAANADATALAESKRIEAFIADFVSKNVTHEAVPDLLELQTRLADDISSEIPSRYAIGQKKATLTIEGLNLARELAAFSVKPAEPAIAAPETATNGLVINALNAELLSGPAEDILVLHNATPEAPHAVRNLLGDLIFDKGRAVTCWAHSVPEADLAVSTAKEQLREAGVSEQSTDTVCEPHLLMETDVVLLRRGDFLRSNVLYARPFVEAFEKGDFRLLAKVEWSEINAEDAANAELAAAIEREVLAGARHGHGWLRFAADGPTLCSIENAAPDAHLAIFESRAPLKPDLPTRLDRTILSAEKAFILVQRRNCLLVYGAAADLAPMIMAAKRDGIAYSVVPDWVTPEATEDAKAEMAAAKTDEQRALAQSRMRAEAEAARRRQEAEARQKLDASQAAAAAETSAARAAELQKTYSQEANGAYNVLYQAAQRHFGDGAGDPTFAALFPDVALWRAQKLGDGWSLATITGELVDYGIASWKERRLEAVFAQVRVRSRNRILGEIDDHCFVVGYLIDAEFEIFRDPVTTSCANADGSLATWKQARYFESRWQAE